MAFATEPVFSSLSNAFEKHENFPSGMPPHLKVFTSFFFSTLLLSLKDGYLLKDDPEIQSSGNSVILHLPGFQGDFLNGQNFFFT